MGYLSHLSLFASNVEAKEALFSIYIDKVENETELKNIQRQVYFNPRYLATKN